MSQNLNVNNINDLTKYDVLNSTPELKARRLKSARLMTGLSAEHFSKQCELSASTLRGWERPHSRQGLTIKGAQLLSQGFNKLGVKCDSTWLLYGVGDGPKLIRTNEINSGNNFEANIMKEACLFEKINKNSITLLLPDDSMLPTYKCNDVVGGIKSNFFNTLINQNAIVKIKNDKRIFVRTIIQSKFSDRFDLMCLNFNYPFENNFIKSVDIEFAAKIIWHRTREN